MSREKLALGGVEDLSRLEFLVPGLRYGQTGHDARLSMRGSRTNSIGPEAASVVGVYEDGVYIPTSTARLNSLLDVERIDVLRGPQITNFGQHAYAGAVNMVTNKPTFNGFHGYAEVKNGIPDRTRWRIVLNIPVTDTLAIRMAGPYDVYRNFISAAQYEHENNTIDLNWLVGLYWSDREAEWGWLEAKDGLIFQPDWDVKGDYLTDTQAVFGQLPQLQSAWMTIQLLAHIRW